MFAHCVFTAIYSLYLCYFFPSTSHIGSVFKALLLSYSIIFISLVWVSEMLSSVAEKLKSFPVSEQILSVSEELGKQIVPLHSVQMLLVSVLASAIAEQR